MPGIELHRLDSVADSYCEKAIAHIKRELDKGTKDEEELLGDPNRAFFMLKNSCGPFKSAYAEAMLQQVLIFNALKNGSKNIDDLDLYSRYCPRTSQNIVYKESMADLEITTDPYMPTAGIYGEDTWVYGAYSALRKGLSAKEWLKFMSCSTKEPAYTSYTNIRGCVDYIFFDDGERGDEAGN
jgi:hypothetical protein